MALGRKLTTLREELLALGGARGGGICADLDSAVDRVFLGRRRRGRRREAAGSGANKSLPARNALSSSPREVGRGCPGQEEGIGEGAKDETVVVD